MDYNVDNYTIDELMAITQLEEPTEDDIIEITNKYTDQYKMKGDFKMAVFF